MWKLLFFVVVISPKWNGEKRVGNSSNLNTFFSIPPRYNTFVFQNYILEDNYFCFYHLHKFYGLKFAKYHKPTCLSKMHVFLVLFIIMLHVYSLHCFFFSKRMTIPRKSVIIFNLLKIYEDIFWLIGFLDFSEIQT